jgi:hypothetical protein
MIPPGTVKRKLLTSKQPHPDVASDVANKLFPLRMEIRPKHYVPLAEDEDAATIVECHFFIGLTFGEIAELLSTPRRTIERKWEFTRAWLNREMTEEPALG